MKELALAHSQFVPVVNHVWGSAIVISANLHLLAAMPLLPGGLFPSEPMFEFDTTHNTFRDELLNNPLNIQSQVVGNGGRVTIPDAPGLGVDPDRSVLERFAVS